MLISATKAALSLCTLLILAVGAFGERRSPWQVRPVERTQPSEGRAEPHHFQEIKFKAVKKHKTKQKKQPWDNSPDMCRLKGAGGRLDVNLPARGSGTKWTNPSEGDRIDLAVYRRSQQQERLCGSERGRLCWGVQVGWHNTFQRVKTQTGVCVCVCVCLSRLLTHCKSGKWLQFIAALRRSFIQQRDKHRVLCNIQEHWAHWDLNKRRRREQSSSPCRYRHQGSRRTGPTLKNNQSWPKSCTWTHRKDYSRTADRLFFWWRAFFFNTTLPETAASNLEQIIVEKTNFSPFQARWTSQTGLYTFKKPAYTCWLWSRSVISESQQLICFNSRLYPLVLWSSWWSWIMFRESHGSLFWNEKKKVLLHIFL